MLNFTFRFNCCIRTFSLAFLLLFSVLLPFQLSQAADSATQEPAPQVTGQISDQMLGSMLMLGFRGTKLADDDPFLKMVAQGKIGNIILFDKDVTDGSQRNISSPEQLRALTQTLKNAAPEPIFIAIDQEGGQVRRLKPQKGFLDLPSAQSLGQGSTNSTFEMADKLGKELRTHGINLDLAPVVDVDSNPYNPAIGRLGRSFGTDAQNVANHALAFGRGLAKNGVAPCLKHFPGQGCAAEDSHLGLTDITQCWNPEVDLAPYAAIFAEGWPGMVMTGHLFHSGLDNANAATVSKKIVTGLLREGMGWNGVVISDDLQMKAISQEKNIKDVMAQAIEAGVDILMFGNNLEWDEELPNKAFHALRELADEGILKPERVEESCKRISALRNAVTH